MKKQLLFVRWHDARGVSENWQDLEACQKEPLKQYIIESVGFLIRESDDAIHIAPHLHEDGDEGHFCGDMQIPTSAIIKSWELE